MKAVEVNFDGIVGPTHNYSGLSYGNVASLQSQKLISNPKEAALQGLQKMHLLMQMGVEQAVIPPQERPYIPLLKSLGFSGKSHEILRKTSQVSPELLIACSSAACMWTANAATVSPSFDTADEKLHLTPANLSSKFHRSIEEPFTHAYFKKIFSDTRHFTVHDPLPAGTYFADEGAANHCRLCPSHGKSGVELFVWGRHSLQNDIHKPSHFPARQTFEASQAISRSHLLETKKIIFAQQNPLAIDAGVFHNDVISVANENVFFHHELAFVNGKEVLKTIKDRLPSVISIEVTEKEASLKEAVETYLFNSQIVTCPDQTMQLIAPLECKSNQRINLLLQKIVEDKKNPIKEVRYLDLRQSMANGGGPACLRLRIVMTDIQRQVMHQGVRLTSELYEQLKQWIKKHYRDRLSPQDLLDPLLSDETQQALQELTSILHLGSIYSFQRELS